MRYIGLCSMVIHDTYIVRLQQMKSGIITWVCTNSPAAPDTSATEKTECAFQLAE